MQQCANVNLIFLLRAVAEPEGSLLGKGGGLTKSAHGAAWGSVWEWIPLLQVRARELPRNSFENLMQILAEFLLISPPKLWVIFALKAPIYLMRDNFHQFKTIIYSPRGNFLSSRSRVGDSEFPGDFFEHWKQMVYSMPNFLHNSC